MAAALITVVTPEAASAQSSATMQPAAFATELERIAAVIASGEPGAVPNIRLPSVWIVETGGQRFETPALWLRTALDRARREPAIWPSRRAALLAQLAALKVEAESLAALTEGDERGPDAAAARSALAGVLAGPEFRHMAQQSAMTRLRQRFTQWLLRIWQRLGGNRLGRRGTAMAFAWVAAFLALGALTTWLVRLIRRPDGGQRLALTQPPRRRRSAGAWAREALLAADPRESSRYAYRATLCRLEEEGVWRADDTRTPREYLRLLPRGHRRRTLLTDVTRRFEEIWYGARQATEEDRRSLLARLKELGCLPAE